jgi:hypothetical protein
VLARPARRTSEYEGREVRKRKPSEADAETQPQHLLRQVPLRAGTQDHPGKTTETEQRPE